jgi:glycosyltransferase involved in cell wall biosynthesis
MKKLLLIGSNSIHTYNYYLLVNDFFDEVVVITDSNKQDYTCKTIIVNFSLRNLISVPRTIATIKETVNSFTPSIIHIHQADSGAFISLFATRKIKTPKILTAWGSDVLSTPSKGYWYKKMLLYILNHADYFSADSADLASVMQRYVKKKLNTLIANFGIDIELGNYTGIKENIIYSNRLHQKLYRIDKIIFAFEFFLKHQQRDWKLVIAGAGEETDNLKELTTSLNLNAHVTFAGWLNKETNLDYYKKAKLFISIPESDATSISLLEAMAAGCIPLVSDLPANKEWIEDGRNGIIVKNGNGNFIQKALALNTTLCSSINQKLIQEKATKESQRKLFIDLYKRILGIQ